MSELKTSIHIDAATDPQSVNDAVGAIVEHIAILHSEVNTLALLIGLAVAASDPKAVLTKFIQTCGTKPEFHHFMAFLQTGLEAGPMPPDDGGTRLRIVQDEKKAA